MSNEPEKVEEPAAEPQLSIARLLVGQLIWLVVTFVVLYLAFTTMNGASGQEVYGAQKTLLLAAGGFILHFAYMVGFRSSRRRLNMISDHLMSVVVTVMLAVTVHAVGVEEGNLAEWAYWLLMAAVVSATMIPVAIYDLIKSGKAKA